MRVIFVGLFLLALSIPVGAQHPCDAFAPYYTQQTGSLGSRMGDLFFFAFSLPVAVAVVGGPRRNVVSSRGEQARVSSAACMPISLVRHFVSTQPPQAEHWRIE